MKKVLLLLSFSILLIARENPFFPPKGLSAPSYTTNKVKEQKPFTPHTLRLPSSARILKSVILKYENLDGSIVTKEVPIQEAIDWHKPFELRHKKEHEVPKQVTKRVKKAPNYTKIASLRFISFYAKKDLLKIVTQDKLLRNFKLVKPQRIVLDFKRDANFRTYSFKGKRNFKKIVVGNHDRYYRVVIELDGRYSYTIDKTKDGYLLQLN